MDDLRNLRPNEREKKNQSRRTDIQITRQTSEKEAMKQRNIGSTHSVRKQKPTLEFTAKLCTKR